MLDANFWQDKNNSKNTIKKKKLFEDLLNTQKASIEKLSDLNEKRIIKIHKFNSDPKNNPQPPKKYF